MVLRRFLVPVFAAATMVGAAGVVSGQTTSTGSGQAFLSKPIRIVTSTSTTIGGSTAVLRLIVGSGRTLATRCDRRITVCGS